MRGYVAEREGTPTSAMGDAGGTSSPKGTTTGSYADEGALLEALDRALPAIRDAEIPFLVMGGIASALHGRHRWTRDVDLFVRLEDGERALDTLAAAGFETEVAYPHWLSKAHLGEVTVDVITRSTPDILLDDEMLARAPELAFKGRVVPLVPPEDLFVMKALATSEDTPRYWYDALGIVGHSELDWDYLIRRARATGPQRVLSALLYARSSDLVVPPEPLVTLFEMVMHVNGAST